MVQALRKTAKNLYMLYHEIDHLREEKNQLQQELKVTNETITSLSLNPDIIRSDDKKSKYLTGLSSEVFIGMF